MQKIFKKIEQNKDEKHLYFSSPFVDIYLTNKKSIIKNYVLDPDLRIIK